MVKSCWRSESFWRLILEPQKIAKVELWFERELNFRICRWHVFFTFFCSEISIILRHPNRIWGGSAYLLHKKSVSPTCIEFRHFRFLRHPNRIWGGSAARDAAHSTSSAYSDGGSLQKKSMGKSKKCALTVKQVSATTWSLTNGEKKTLFLVFFEKSYFCCIKKPLLAYRIYKKWHFWIAISRLVTIDFVSRETREPFDQSGPKLMVIISIMFICAQTPSKYGPRAARLIGSLHFFGI